MRLNLKVSFAEKDQAKKLGARWDPARKVWYIQGKGGAAPDAAPFARWSPTPHDATADVPAASARSAAPRQSAPGKRIVGSQYVERPRVCDCLPWDVCDACRPAAFTR